MRDDPERDEGAAEGTVFGHANHYAWTPRTLEALKEEHQEWYEPLMNIINGAESQQE